MAVYFSMMSFEFKSAISATKWQNQSSNYELFDLRLLLAVRFWIVWKIVLKRRPSSGQQLVIKVNSAILKSQLSIIFEIPDDIELWMTLGKTIVTNIIFNTSLSYTCPQQTRNMQRGTENVLIWAITTGTKWDRELRAVTSFRILNTDWSKWTCGAQTSVRIWVSLRDLRTHARCCCFLIRDLW